jgi:anthranilate phosphoribosyltransferase
MGYSSQHCAALIREMSFSGVRMNIQEAIKKITTMENLTTSECCEVFNQIMSGEATPAQIAGFLIALRMKGETVEEITGAAQSMRDKATHVTVSNPSHVIDTCGTGGDGANTFNISTAAAFVAAGAGATVAKHGNRSVSSKCGSADVLEALGVNLAVPPEKMQHCLDHVGICFLFAPALHTAMKFAIGPRKELGVRTLFNILGPLTNPANAPRQLLGVFTAELTEQLGHVLANLGSTKAYVVHGLNRLDEISISAPTQVSELSEGRVTTYQIQPEDFGIKRAPDQAILGGEARQNAQIIRDIFAGQQGPHRDVVVLNAGFALAAAGVVATPAEGIAKAAATIDSGAAGQKLEQLCELTKG